METFIRFFVCFLHCSDFYEINKYYCKKVNNFASILQPKLVNVNIHYETYYKWLNRLLAIYIYFKTKSIRSYPLSQSSLKQ